MDYHFASVNRRLINDNWSCRPVASPKNVAETLAPEIRSDQRQFRQGSGLDGLALPDIAAPPAGNDPGTGRPETRRTPDHGDAGVGDYVVIASNADNAPACPVAMRRDADNIPSGMLRCSTARHASKTAAAAGSPHELVGTQHVNAGAPKLTNRGNTQPSSRTFWYGDLSFPLSTTVLRYATHSPKLGRDPNGLA